MELVAGLTLYLNLLHGQSKYPGLFISMMGFMFHLLTDKKKFLHIGSYTA